MSQRRPQSITPRIELFDWDHESPDKTTAESEAYVTLEGLARIQLSHFHRALTRRFNKGGFETLADVYSPNIGNLPRQIAESYEFSDGEMADAALVRKSFAFGYFLGLIATHETSRQIHLHRFTRLQSAAHRLNYINVAPELYFGDQSVLRDFASSYLLYGLPTKRQKFTVEHTAGLALLGYEESRYEEYARAQMVDFRQELRDIEPARLREL